MKPSYWQGCPSTYKRLDCTNPKGHEGRHSFLGERYWTVGDGPDEPEQEETEQ